MMKATPEWMRENYNRFNQELFGGELGDCQLELFTTGRGSQGRTLGWFIVTNRKVRASRYDGSMYIDDFGRRTYINKNNFVELCRPCIQLNGNYSGTEDALQNTLVHEMVHYYDYMYGNCPKQGHGPRFRRISAMVASKSNGKFSISRLASAETMSNYKLDDEMQAKRDRRTANKKARAMAIFVYLSDGSIQLTMINRENSTVLRQICTYFDKRRDEFNEIITSSDPELIEMLYNSGFKRLMRTWRYWNVENQPWIGNVKKYNFETILKNNDMKENTIHNIVETVINEYVGNLDKEGVKVGGINLGLHSPFEEME